MAINKIIANKQNKKSVLVYMWCLVFGLSSAVQAEEIVMDLDKAVEMARTADKRISEKQQLVNVAQGMLTEAKGINSWIFDVNTFLGLSPNVKGGVLEDAQGRVALTSDALDFDGVSPWYKLDFKIVKPLHTFGKEENYTEAAKYNIEVRRGDVNVQMGQTYLDVVKAYNGYLAARDSRLLLEDSYKKLNSAVELVEQWLDEGEGKAKQSDLYALRTGAGVLQRYMAEAQGLENIAMAGLRMLTGVSANDTVKLADKRVKAVDLPEDSLEQLQEKALKLRPEMKQVAAGLGARRALVAAKQSEAYPNIYWGIGGIVSYSPERPNLEEISVVDPYNTAGATPVIGMKWDWWAGRQQGQVEQAQAELNALVEKKAFALQGIPFQVAEQYHQVHAHHDMVNNLYDASKSGRRWMIASYADFEAGVEEADKVVTAFQGYLLAYGEYLKIVNDYNLHVARLRVVTGEIQ